MDNISKPIDGVTDNGPYYAVGSGDNQERLCVMLHGLGGDSYELSPLGKVLNNEGYSVLGLRYPGHGLDEDKLSYSSWKSWAAHGLEEINAVSDNHKKITLIGFSTGGPLALYLSQYLNINSLILLAPFFELRHRPHYIFRPYQWLELTLPLIAHILAPPLPISCRRLRKKAEFFRRYRWFNLQLITSAQELITAIQPVLPSVKVPILWIYSSNDTVVCNQAAKKAFLIFKSAIKLDVMLSRSNHILCHDTESDTINQQVVMFLNNF